MPNIINIFKKDFSDFQLKSGMVIQLIKKEEKNGEIKDRYINMICVDSPKGMIAVEEYLYGDNIHHGEYTLASYTYVDKQHYPETLGIEPNFGDEVVAIYPHIDLVSEDETIYRVMYYNKDGEFCSKSCL